jgi:hypothetical protein
MTYLYEDTSVSHSAADSTTSDWLSEGEELVRLRAKTDLLENYIRGQEALLEAQVLSTRENEVFANLRRLANRQASAGKLTPRL